MNRSRAATAWRKPCGLGTGRVVRCQTPVSDDIHLFIRFRQGGQRWLYGADELSQPNIWPAMTILAPRARRTSLETGCRVPSAGLRRRGTRRPAELRGLGIKRLDEAIYRQPAPTTDQAVTGIFASRLGQTLTLLLNGKQTLGR